MVIALCSLGLSIYEARMSRRHDRLSVRPRLSVSFDFNDKGTGWTLINDGLGPARIRGLKIVVNGTQQRPTEYFPEILAILNLPLPPENGLTFANIDAGENIPSGSGGPYIKPWLIVTPSKAADALRAVWRHVDFEICYCSIYDECWLLRDKKTVRDDVCSSFVDQPHSIWWNG